MEKSDDWIKCPVCPDAYYRWAPGHFKRHMWSKHQIEVSGKKPGPSAKAGLIPDSNKNSPITNTVPATDEVGTDNVMEVISDVVRFVLYDVNSYSVTAIIQEIGVKFPVIPKIMIPVLTSIVTSTAWHVSRTSHEVQCFRDSCDDEGKKKYDSARRALLKWFTGVNQEERGIKRRKIESEVEMDTIIPLMQNINQPLPDLENVTEYFDNLQKANDGTAEIQEWAFPSLHDALYDDQSKTLVDEVIEDVVKNPSTPTLKRTYSKTKVSAPRPKNDVKLVKHSAEGIQLVDPRLEKKKNDTKAKDGSKENSSEKKCETKVKDASKEKPSEKKKSEIKVKDESKEKPSEKKKNQKRVEDESKEKTSEKKKNDGLISNKEKTDTGNSDEKNIATSKINKEESGKQKAVVGITKDVNDDEARKPIIVLKKIQHPDVEPSSDEEPSSKLAIKELASTISKPKPSTAVVVLSDSDDSVRTSTLKEVEAKLLYLQKRREDLLSPMSKTTNDSIKSSKISNQPTMNPVDPARRVEHRPSPLKRKVAVAQYSYYRSPFVRQNWMFHRGRQNQQQERTYDNRRRY